MLDQYIHCEIRRSWIKNSFINHIITPYISYLECRGYNKLTIRFYLQGVAHFSHWLNKKRYGLSRIDKDLVDQFIVKHLPICSCPMPCFKTKKEISASLNHLLSILAKGKTSNKTPLTAIEKELRQFDQYLNQVCGLSVETRSSRIRYVRSFLNHRFGQHQIKIKTLKPNDIFQFVNASGITVKTSTMSVICTSLRSYLRYRINKGDRTQKR